MRVAAFRAAETGRSVAFVNRSGPSGAFGPRGATLARLPRGQPAIGAVDLPVSTAVTPYVLLGDWLGVLATIASTVVVVVAWRRSRADVAPG